MTESEANFWDYVFSLVFERTANTEKAGAAADAALAARRKAGAGA